MSLAQTICLKAKIFTSKLFAYKLCICTLPVFSHPQKFLFLILKVLFLKKQVKHHNGFIYHTKYKSVLVFNWNHFEMRLLNLRINFLFIADFLSSSWYFFLCCFFFTMFQPNFTWRRPEVKFGRNIVKKKQHKKKKYQDEDKKSAINKKLILKSVLNTN